MVPDIAGTGHSFMGAMAYYLHDKRQEAGAAHPETSERVAWTETRNLAGVGPHTATRAMIDHAQRAAELKAAAGIKATGRKSNAHVYAFSLSWRQDEVAGLDRAEMIRATDAALKFLGADHLQAVVIAHTDRDHPHVHVVLNRVQADGRMWTAYNDRPKLSEWANGYERDNGKIVTPKRDEKRRKIEEGQKANPDPKQRRAHVAKRQAERATEQRPPSRGQMLKELADAQKARHRQDWKDWAARAKADRKAIYDGADAQKQLALAHFKASTRGDWAQHFRAERDRARAFEARERSLSGLVMNALAAAKQQFRAQPQGGRGMLSLTFANVLDSAARRKAFDLAQDMTKAKFTAAMKEQRAAHLAVLEREKRRALILLSATIDKGKADMMARQDNEREKMREAWRQFYASRESVAPGQTYRTRKPQPLPVKDHRPMKDKFDAASLAAAKFTAERVPTDDYRLSTPAPAPRPAGIVDPPHSDMKPIPAVDKSAAIEEPRTPSARRDWTQPIDTPPPAPQKAKPMPGGIDWKAEAQRLREAAARGDAAPAPQQKPQAGGIDWKAEAQRLRTEHGNAAAPDQPTQRPNGPRMKP